MLAPEDQDVAAAPKLTLLVEIIEKRIPGPTNHRARIVEALIASLDYVHTSRKEAYDIL